jgi:hypothetical protein
VQIGPLLPSCTPFLKKDSFTCGLAKFLPGLALNAWSFWLPPLNTWDYRPEPASTVLLTLHTGKCTDLEQGFRTSSSSDSET